MASPSSCLALCGGPDEIGRKERSELEGTRGGVAFTLKLFTTGDGLPGFGLIIDSVRALEVSGQLFIEKGREG